MKPPMSLVEQRDAALAECGSLSRLLSHASTRLAAVTAERDALRAWKAKGVVTVECACGHDWQRHDGVISTGCVAATEDDDGECSTCPCLVWTPARTVATITEAMGGTDA